MQLNDWKKQVLNKYLLKYYPAEAEVEHILDYLNNNPNIKYSVRLSYEQVLEKANKWTEELNERNRNLQESGKVEVIQELKGGFKLVRLLNQTAKDWEGLHMGHCVASYKDHEGIYSLRDKEHFPHCTLELKNKEIVQIKGKADRQVAERYVELVFESLNALKCVIRETDLRENLSCVKINSTGVECLDYFAGYSLVEIGSQKYLSLKSKAKLIKPIAEKNTKLLQFLIDYPINMEALAKLVELDDRLKWKELSVFSLVQMKTLMSNVFIRQEWALFEKLVGKIKFINRYHSYFLDFLFALTASNSEMFKVVLKQIHPKGIVQRMNSVDLVGSDNLAALFILAEKVAPNEFYTKDMFQLALARRASKVINHFLNINQTLKFNIASPLSLYAQPESVLLCLEKTDCLVDSEYFKRRLTDSSHAVCIEYIIENDRADFDILDYALDTVSFDLIELLRKKGKLSLKDEQKIEQKQAAWSYGQEVVLETSEGGVLSRIYSSEIFDSLLATSGRVSEALVRHRRGDLQWLNSSYLFKSKNGKDCFFSWGNMRTETHIEVIDPKGMNSAEIDEIIDCFEAKNHSISPILDSLGYIFFESSQYEKENEKIIKDYLSGSKIRSIGSERFVYLGAEVRLKKEVKNINTLISLLWIARGTKVSLDALESFLSQRELFFFRPVRKILGLEAKENHKIIFGRINTPRSRTHSRQMREILRKYNVENDDLDILEGGREY